MLQNSEDGWWTFSVQKGGQDGPISNSRNLVLLLIFSSSKLLKYVDLILFRKNI